MDSMLSLGRMISRGSSLLSPRGKVLENGMPRFFRRFGEGVFDIEDLKNRSGELADFVEKASETYDFDVNAVIAVGYSNGANIGASIILLQLFRFAGAILFRPMVPLIPNELSNLDKMVVFISAGAFDQIVPRGEPERLARLLGDAGAEVTLSWENSTHALTQSELEKAANWLLQNLGS